MLHVFLLTDDHTRDNAHKKFECAVKIHDNCGTNENEEEKTVRWIEHIYVLNVKLKVIRRHVALVRRRWLEYARYSGPHATYVTYVHIIAYTLILTTIVNVIF